MAGGGILLIHPISLVRSGLSPVPTCRLLTASRAGLVEFLFVNDEQVVVVQRARSSTRLALAVVCTREPNLAFVLSSTRRAMHEIEGTIDLAVWEV